MRSGGDQIKPKGYSKAKPQDQAGRFCCYIGAGHRAITLRFDEEAPDTCADFTLTLLRYTCETHVSHINKALLRLLVTISWSKPSHVTKANPSSEYRNPLKSRDHDRHQQSSKNQ